MSPILQPKVMAPMLKVTGQPWRVISCAEHCLQAIQECECPLGVDLGHEQRELIAAEPGEQVRIAQMEVNRLDNL